MLFCPNSPLFVIEFVEFPMSPQLIQSSIVPDVVTNMWAEYPVLRTVKVGQTWRGHLLQMTEKRPSLNFLTAFASSGPKVHPNKPRYRELLRE